MASFIQFLINAAAISSLFALVAIGFTLIFGVGNVLNFAHAGFLTAGAYAAYQVSNPNRWGMNIWLGTVASIAVGALLGAVIYWGVVRYLQRESVIVAIVTLLIGFIIMFFMLKIYGANTIQIRSPAPGISKLAGFEIQTHFVFVFIVSWIIIGALVAFVNNTEPGKAILATSMTEKGAALVGINSDRINLYTWTLAGGLAGFAGLMLTAFQTGSPILGIDPMVLSFAIVILGGLGSIRGSIVGAYVIGFLETATTTYVSPTLTGVVPLMLMIIVLLVRPNGLFGREAAE